MKIWTLVWGQASIQYRIDSYISMGRYYVSYERLACIILKGWYLVYTTVVCSIAANYYIYCYWLTKRISDIIILLHMIYIQCVIALMFTDIMWLYNILKWLSVISSTLHVSIFDVAPSGEWYYVTVDGLYYSSLMLLLLLLHSARPVDEEGEVAVHTCEEVSGWAITVRTS